MLARQKRGSGLLLLLVIACSSVLFLLFFYQSRVTSWTSAGVDVLIRGDIAERLAESHVQEKIAFLRWASRSPDTKLYDELRRAFEVGDEEQLSLKGCVRSPQIETLLESAFGKGYTLEESVVEVAHQRSIDGNPYERQGLILLRSAVQSPQGISRAALRRVERVLPFKVILTSLPRPYCAYGFFLGNANALIDADRVNALRGQLLSLLQQIWDRAATLGIENDIKDWVSTVERAEAGAKLLPSGNAALYGLLWEGLEQDMSTLSLSSHLQQSKNAIETELPGADDARSLRRLGERVSESLWRIWAFTKAFKLLKPSDAAYEAFEESRHKFASPFWQRRVTHVVKAEDWPRFDRSYPEKEGVVWIGNQSKEFLLTGELAGRVVIVTGPGGVRLRDFNLEDDEDTRVVVVSLGGSVSIEKEVNAAIVLAQGEMGPVDEFHMAEGYRLNGAIVAWDFHASTSLNGILRRKEKYSSGHNAKDGVRILQPEHLHVALSPVSQYRRVERK